MCNVSMNLLARSPASTNLPGRSPTHVIRNMVSRTCSIGCGW